jgi:hypothetical protein
MPPERFYAFTSPHGVQPRKRTGKSLQDLKTYFSVTFNYFQGFTSDLLYVCWFSDAVSK